MGGVAKGVVGAVGAIGAGRRARRAQRRADVSKNAERQS